MNKYCYSWDDKNYSSGTYDTEEDAINAAKQDNPDAEEVWIGIAEKPKLRWNSNEEAIIDSIQEDLEEECGGFAEDAFDISREQELDLAKMIDKTVKAWIEKYKLEPSCYTAIDCGLHVLN